MIEFKNSCDNKHALTEFWKSSFGDSDAYINMLYELGYLNPDNIFVLYDKNELVSALAYTVYKLKLFNSEIDVPYLCYVATLKKHRNKGYASKIMHESIKELYKRGFIFTSLIPSTLSLFDFYGRFGFTGVFNIYERKYIPEESSSSFEAANNKDIGVLMSFYEKYKEKMKKCDVCVYRSKSLFESLIKEYSAGAGTDVIYNEKCIAFIEYSEDCIIIKEYAGEIDAQSISDFFGKYVYLQEPFIFAGIKKRLGMGRILNLHEFMARLPINDYRFEFSVRDNIISENNISVGMDNKFIYHTELSADINIDGFLNYILKNRTAYLNAMLN